MKTTLRTYETLYIVDPNLTDEQVQTITDHFAQTITDQGAEVQAAGKWDKRRLTYEVKGRNEGIFVLMYFVAEAGVSKELDRVMRISDDILRHIILRVEPQHVDTTRIIPTSAPVEAVEVVEAVSEEAPAQDTAEVPAAVAEVEEVPAETAIAEDAPVAVEEVAVAAEPEVVAEAAPEVPAEVE